MTTRLAIYDPLAIKTRPSLSLYLTEPPLANGGSPTNSAQPSADPPKQSASLFWLSFRIRIFDPRFLATEIGVTVETELTPELGIASSLEPVDQLLKSRRFCVSAIRDHDGGLVPE
jgi:hypothetical protein